MFTTGHLCHTHDELQPSYSIFISQPIALVPWLASRMQDGDLTLPIQVTLSGLHEAICLSQEAGCFNWVIFNVSVRM